MLDIEGSDCNWSLVSRLMLVNEVLDAADAAGTLTATILSDRASDSGEHIRCMTYPVSCWTTKCWTQLMPQVPCQNHTCAVRDKSARHVCVTCMNCHLTSIYVCHTLDYPAVETLRNHPPRRIRHPEPCTIVHPPWNTSHHDLWSCTTFGWPHDLQRLSMEPAVV